MDTDDAMERWRLAGWLGARPRRRTGNPSTFAGNNNTCASLPFGGADAAGPAGEDASAPFATL